MAPRTLTVLAAIRPGEEEPLRDVLRPIGDDVKGKRLAPGPSASHRVPPQPADPLRALRHPRRSRSRARSQAAALLGELRRRPRRPPRRIDCHHLRHGRDLGPCGRLRGSPAPSRRSSARTRRSRRPSTSPSATKPSSASSDAIAFRRRAQTLVDEASSAPLAALLPRLSSGAPAWATGRAPSGVAAVERLFRALPIVADLFRAVARCGIGNVVSRRAAHHRQPGPLSAVPLVEPADGQPHAAATIAVLERAARQLHRAGAARARRRSAVGSGPSVAAGLQGRRRSRRTSSRSSRS